MLQLSVSYILCRWYWTSKVHPICHSLSSTYLQQDLDSIAQWCANWKHSINGSQCSVLPFFLSSSSPPVGYIEGKPIKQVEQYKDLGILVQSDLSWSEHIAKICAKAYRSVHLFRCSILSTSPSLRLSFYLALVWTKLSYCSRFWRPRLIKDIICLERVHLRATNILLNDCSTRPDYHYYTLLAPERHILNSLCLRVL